MFFLHRQTWGARGQQTKHLQGVDENSRLLGAPKKPLYAK
jgi:hypothetical protein